MSKEFFPPRPESRPTIYAYEDTNPQYEGLLKIGYTMVDVKSRVAQQYPTLRPGKPPHFLMNESGRVGVGPSQLIALTQNRHDNLAILL